MAKALPTMADYVQDRIELLRNDPRAYYEARLTEEIRAIDMSNMIMKAAGLSKEPEI